MDDILELYPQRDCEYENNDGLITVHFFKKKLGFLDRTIFKKFPQKPSKIDLDEIGSFIWELCDRNLNVAEIIEKSKDHFKERIEPADQRVVLFLKQLSKTHLITLFQKTDPADKTETNN